MSNVISDRIAFFLKDHPPFSYLEMEELTAVAERMAVRFCEKDEKLFSENESGQEYGFILRKGNIKLTKSDAGDHYLLDQCEPGDIVGVRSIITGNPYLMTATCVEESLVYLIKKQDFLRLLKRHHTFSMYFASGYAAGQAVVRDTTRNVTPVKTQTIEPTIDYTKNVVNCSKETSIHEAAKLMKKAGVGSLPIVDKRNLPIGILTDTDLRNKVLAENRSADEPVSSVMSSPVKTIRKSFTLSEVQIRMIRSGVHHMVVTENGTDKSPVVGLISDHDLMVSLENHPAALIKAIKYSNEPREWKSIRDKTENLVGKYLEQELSVSLITSLVTAINDAIIEKAIELAINEIPDAATIDFCWIGLGSEGREEQLLRTDQDNAIIFQDSTDNEETKKILLKVAIRVNEILKYCGFEDCPAEIMARNPKYCESLNQWKSYFEQWILEPEPEALMQATIFFDFRGVVGDKNLASELEEFLFSRIKKESIFLNHLARNALQNPPPIGFFKNFLVEKSGAHRNEFDIKKRAMMPLSDAARVLALEAGIRSVQNTRERWEMVSEADPKNKEIYREAVQAYEIFMKIRTQSGLNNNDSGRFIDLDALTRLEKSMMKKAFRPIRDIQEMMEVRFQLSYFS